MERPSITLKCTKFLRKYRENRNTFLHKPVFPDETWTFSKGNANANRLGKKV